VDDRRVISGIVHVLKSGGRWIDAPPNYGPKKTLYNRYVRWAAKGVWVNHALAQAGGPPAQVLIDSSAVKAHRSASGGFRDIPKMRPDEFVWPGFESPETAAIWAADPFIGREQALKTKAGQMLPSIFEIDVSTREHGTRRALGDATK